MPFGLENVPGYLSDVNGPAADHLTSIIAIHDDICVYGYMPRSMTDPSSG